MSDHSHESAKRRRRGAEGEASIKRTADVDPQRQIAILQAENRRISAELQERTQELDLARQQQTATSEVLQVISRSGFEVQAVLDTVVETAAHLCEAERGFIHRFQDGLLPLAASYNASAELLEFIQGNPIRPGMHSGVARAALLRQSIHIEDVRSDPEYSFGAAQIDPIRTVLAAPILRGDDLLGVVVIYRLEVRPFTQRQIALVSGFATQAAIAIENARLFEEVQARTRELSDALQQQTTTSEVLQVISRSPFDLQTVLDTLVESVTRLCNADHSWLFLREGDCFRFFASFGHAAEVHKRISDYLKPRPVPMDRGSVTGRTAIEAKVVHVPDVLTDPDYTWSEAQRLGGYRAALGVPLLREGRVTGVIFVAKGVPGPFTHKEIELARTFADQAVIAVENTRLFDEVRARTQELQASLDYQTATSDVLSVISRSPSKIEPVLQVIVDTAARLCAAEYALAYILKADGRYHTITANNAEAELVKFALAHPLEPGRGSLIGRTALERGAVHIEDCLADPEYELRDFQRVGKFRSMLGVPLLRDGVAIGALGLLRNAVAPFTDRQIELVTTFADQAVIAIENARLFEEVQARTRELQQSLEYQTATGNVLGVISRSTTELQPALQSIVEIAAELCEGFDATILLREGDHLRVGAHHGSIPLDFDTKPISRAWITGRAVLDREPIHVKDLARAQDDFPEGHDLYRRYGHRTGLAIPLLQDGDAIGAFMIRRMQVAPFTPKQIAVLQTFADQAVIAINNVRLFDEVQARTRELQESLKYQTATSEVLNVISRSPSDIQPVLDTIVETARRLCEAFDGIIFLREGDSLKVAAHQGRIPIRFNSYPINRGWLAGRSVVDRRPVMVDDLLAAEHEFPDGYRMARSFGHRTTLATPLVRDEEAIGTIVIRRAEVRPFSEKQITILQTFADQAVIAINNVRLFEEVQARTRELSEALEQQTATSEVLQVISRSTFDLQPVLETLVASATTLCRADKGFLFLISDGHSRLQASFGFGREFHDFVDRVLDPTDPGTLVGRVVQERCVVHIEDVANDPRYTWAEAVRRGSLGTLLGVPLLRGDELIGVFSLARTQPHGFTDKQIEVVQTFSDQAVIAIGNVRLFEEVQSRTRELARSVMELQALSEVSQAVNSSLDLEKVLETIVAKAVELSGTDAGAIYVYSTRRQGFRLRATCGMDDEVIQAIRRAAAHLAETAVGEAVKRREPVQVPDLRDQPPSPVHDIIVEAGYRGLLIVPLLRLDRVVGALVVRRKQPGMFPEGTVRLLMTFAEQSVLAIQNARLFAEIEEKGRELAEASRHKSQFLANMSHELRTPLNSVLGFTEMMADGLYGDLPERAKAALGKVQNNGRHLLGLINDVLDLSKIEAGQLTLSLDDYSLGQVVSSVVTSTENLARAKGLALEVSVPPALPIGRGDERRLTQVIINLVGNAIKFTETGSIEIAARMVGDFFEVEVRDTGPGIAPEDQGRIFEEFQQVDDTSTRKKGGTGLGLAISRRIVEMHGGTLTVRSALGEGSTFTMRVPLQVEMAEEAAWASAS